MKHLLTLRFQFYKNLGEKAMEPLMEDELHWQYNEESNSIAVLVNHISGNMQSRFTNFLTEDGEKPWRNRDAEFENSYQSKEELLNIWEKGWDCLFQALEQLDEENLKNTVTIRGEAMLVADALFRQLSHYAYHVGQMVYIAKMIKNSDWKSLSIPKNKSKEFNAKMLNKNEDLEQENASPVCFAKSNEIRDEYK
ncbi:MULTISPECIES: DUF1572 family protein [Amniculibacterium]|uniref:DUF1572 family protein n=1 Tax=Amniculibacterium TaxID=2715289 RepID=UPI000F5962F2|nr:MULTISPECIES: DUF1572 family protein [Amniculibacterium]